MRLHGLLTPAKHLYLSHLPPNSRTSDEVTNKLWSTALFEKLSSSVAKKFPAFYRTRRFITGHSRASTCLSWLQINPVHDLVTYFIEIKYSIFLTTSRSSKCRFPWSHHSSPPYAPPISFFLMKSPGYMMRSTSHEAPDCGISNSLLLLLPP